MGGRWTAALLQHRPELAELGGDVRLDVIVTAMIAGVVLVVVLGRDRRPGTGRAGSRSASERPLGVQCAACAFSGGLLLGLAVVEDDRAVLGAEVGPLAVQGRRVVGVPEHLQQLVEARRRRRRTRSGSTSACPVRPVRDHLVGRVGDVPAGVARDDRLDPRDPLEDRLGAPEAAAAERRRLDLGLLGSASSSASASFVESPFLGFASASAFSSPWAPHPCPRVLHPEPGRDRAEQDEQAEKRNGRRGMLIAGAPSIKNAPSRAFLLPSGEGGPAGADEGRAL